MRLTRTAPVARDMSRWRLEHETICPMPRLVDVLAPPALTQFMPAERRIIERSRTPRAVQAWLNALPYNTETGGETQRSFRGVVRTGRAHCMEAALSAAVILEQHGYPPLVMSLESADHLDHVIFVYRTAGGWGSIARSRDPGLHGRKAVFRRPRDLALSYVDPYVDFTGRVTAYGLVDLRELMGRYDWRLSPRNLWAVEQALIELPHRPIRSSTTRIERLRRKYVAYRRSHNDRKPIFYDRSRWTPIPDEFLERRTSRRKS
jgi:hypothetical protein